MLAHSSAARRSLTNGGIVGTIVIGEGWRGRIVIRSEDTRLRIKRNVISQVLGVRRGRGGQE